jgi:hypothetical protein
MGCKDYKYKKKKIFKAKEKFHRQRAKMSFGKKIKQLVKLQKLANEIKSNTNRETGYIWQI